MNLTIIIIKNMHVFDCTFGCAFYISNVCGRIEMQMFTVRIQMQMHSNAHSNMFAFVNKPDQYLGKSFASDHNLVINQTNSLKSEV